MSDSTQTTISTAPVSISEFSANTFDISIMDPERMQATADRVSKMSREQQVAWANTVTGAIRDRVLVMAGKWFEFDEARRRAIEICQEAYAGQVWKILKFSSWDEYFSTSFSDTRLYNSREERDSLIRTLKDNHFSYRMIAPMVNMTNRGVAKVYNKLSSTAVSGVEQVGTEFPPAQNEDSPESSKDEQVSTKWTPAQKGDSVESSENVQAPTESTPVHSGESVASEAQVADAVSDTSSHAPAADTTSSSPVSSKTKSLDGKDYSMPRSHDAMVADWMWMKSLKDMQGLTQRAIEARTGIPQTTVGRILREGEPNGHELAGLALKARRLSMEQALSRGMIAERMGLRLDAVEWLLDKQRDPAVRDVIDKSCLLDQQYGGKCRLIDGAEMRQIDIARLCGVSQSMVSQTLESLRRSYGLEQKDRKRLADEGQPDYELPDNPSLADMSDHRAGQMESVYKREGETVNGYIPEAGPAQWARGVDEEIMRFDPTMPETATPYYTAYARCAADLLSHLNGPSNMVLSHSEVLDTEAAKQLLETLESFSATLERGLPKLRRYVEQADLFADLEYDDDDEEEM